MQYHEKFANTFSEVKTPFTMAMCSGKGGVGKSVITANLALELSRRDFKTLVWDADMQFPNQHLIMGVEPPVRMSQIYKKRVNVENAFFNVNKNLDLLADSPAIGENGDYSPEAILDVFQDIILYSDYEVILIDTASGADRNVINASRIADCTSIVITDEPTSLLDAYGLIKILLNYCNKDEIKVIVNNAIDFEDAEEMTTKLNLAADKFLHLVFDNLGFVPYDRIVRHSIIQQQLFLDSTPNSDASKALIKLADKVEQLAKRKISEKA